MTTTLLSSQGKYRPRKEWSTNSIPTLVSLEEETAGAHSPHGTGMAHNGNGNGGTAHNNNAALPPKAPRRSSLAITTGLMMGRSAGGGKSDAGGLSPVPVATDKPNRRRSSIAVSFLGRHSKVMLAPRSVSIGCVVMIVVSTTTPHYNY